MLLTVCFSLATLLQPRAAALDKEVGSGGVLNILLGDSRRLFANHFFVKADVYFHSGYYPSIFDQALAPTNSAHMTAQEGSAAEEAHEKQMDFLRPPRDCFERFGRHFLITAHTHLQGGKEREILPWLKLSAELDPHRIDTYTVAAYWLRNPPLNKVAEAEEFLRDGLRNNPDSYEILFELGRLERENHHDNDRARNLWEIALRRWHQQQDKEENPDNFIFEQITVNLARLEEETGHFDRAITYLGDAAKVSPAPDALREQIKELKQKQASGNQPVKPAQP